MMTAEVRKKVINIISDQLAKSVDLISENSYFIDDLGADSLDTVEIIMTLEEVFGIEFSEDEQETIRTVGDIISYIERKLKPSN